jgi:hypothetical protein
LDLIYDYCTKWKLTVNLEKSNILVCKPFGGVSMQEVWFWGENIIDHCDTYKYLGIAFTRYGISHASINMLNDQAKKSLVSLWSGMNAIGKFPPAAALRIFHTSIVPILNYASEVWGYMAGLSMQITLNRFCKNILGVKLSTSNAAVAGELGQYPLIIQRKINMLKYWMKMLNGPRNRLRFTMYSYLRDNIDKDLPVQCKNWALEVRNILIEIGREYVWDDNSQITDDFISSAKQTLIDLHIAEWLVELQSSSKYISYVEYKTIFAHEPYLVNIKSYQHRRALSCLRLSSHKLEIEVGRYNPPKPRDRRHCRVCDTGDIEDEFHFILVCPKYVTLRRKLIPRYFWHRPNMGKFIDLMTRDDLNIKLARYIHESLAIREL